MIQDHAAAALAVDRELLQECHTRLHRLGAAEQGSGDTESQASIQAKEYFIYLMCGNRNVSYSS